MNKNNRLSDGFLVFLVFLGAFFLPAAQATTYTFADTGTPPFFCTRNSPGNYTCPSTTLLSGDEVVINGTRPATVTFTGTLTLDQVTINSGGAASSFNLVVNNALQFTNTAALLNGNVKAGSLCANNSNCAGHTYGGNLVVTAGNAILGAGSTVAGTVNVTGNLTLDRITLGQTGNSGPILTSTGTLTLANSASTFNGHVNVAGWSCAGNNCTQTVNGNLTVSSGAVTLAFGSAVSGVLTVKGAGAAVTLGRSTLGSPGFAGLVVDTTGVLTLTNSGSTFNGNISTGGWSCAVANCIQTINGSLIVGAGVVTLGNGSIVTGVLTAKGTGGAVALDRVTLGTAGFSGLVLETIGALSFTNSGATMHGNVSTGSWSCAGTNCAQTVNGTLTVTTGKVQLAAGAAVKGTITAKGTGGAVVLDQVTVGSVGYSGTIIDTIGSVTFTGTGATLHGNVISASFTGKGSETVNGSITTTAIPGTVFGSSTTVTGCVSSANSFTPKAIQYGTGSNINSTCCRMTDNSCYEPQDCVSGNASKPAFCSGATFTYEQIIVNASGSSATVTATDIWPVMELWINGVKVDSKLVGSTTATNYVFSATAVAPYPAVIQSIDIVFINDAVVGAADRNLTVNKVTVRGKAMLPTDPGVVYELPYSGYAPPTQLLAGQAILYSNGALRFNSTPLIVGTCFAGITGYTTIALALAAANAGDAITICPGTYNESLNISKSVGLRSPTTPASAAAATVIINGGSAPAIAIPNASTATNLSLTGLKLQSTGNALSAAYVNAGNTNYSLSFIEISSTGTAIELGSSNPGQFSMNNSTVNSTAGMGLNFGPNAANRLNLTGNMVINSLSAGINFVGQYNASYQHVLQAVQIKSTGSGASAMDFRSGRLYLDDVAVTSNGVGIYHDAGHSVANFFRGVTVRSVGDGIKTMLNLNGQHTYDNVYIRTTGSGSKGLWQTGGLTFNDLDIQSDGDALYLDRTNGQAQIYTNLTLVSSNGYGLRVVNSGNSITGIMSIGTATGPVKISAGQQGIYLGDSMAASATLNLNNIDISSARDGIYLDANMGPGTLNIGNLAQVKIKTTSTTSGDVWGLYVSKGVILKIVNLAVDSSKGGVYLNSNVTGQVTLQGVVTMPIRITANGVDSHALYMNNTGGTALIDRVILRQPNGYGLEARANATIATISNFDFSADGPALNVLSPSVNLAIKDGTATSGRVGVPAINLDVAGACSKAHTMTNVIASVGAGGNAINVKCASTFVVTGSCTIGGLNGMYFDSNAGKVTATGNSLGGYSGSGVQLQTATASSSVNNNCFTTATNPMAFAIKSVASTFSTNYWQDLVSGNKYQPDPSGNAVNDQTPRATCQLASTLCTGAPSAALIAYYRFEEGTPYSGVSGEVKDVASYSGGPFNGKVIGAPLAEKLNLLPARTGSTGTCGYLNLSGPAVNGGAVEIANLPVSTADGAQTSVSFWMYWRGGNTRMMIGWQFYDLFFAYSGIGFNTANSDLWGTANTGLANGWHHVVAVFTNGDVTKNKLYIDGVSKTLTDQSAGAASTSLSRAVQSTMRIGGWVADGQYRFDGRIDEVKVFNGAVNQSQVADLYNETHNCFGSGPIAEWRMDELLWNGTVGEVKDSSPYAQHASATAVSGYARPSAGPGGKVCGRGNFTSTYNFVDVADSAIDRLQSPFTMMGWINMASYGSYQYIFSNTRDCCGVYRGFELSGRYGTSPPAFTLWFDDGTLGQVTANSTLATGVWAHVTGVWDGSNMKIYVNGALINTRSYAGKTMAGPSSFPGTLGAMGRNAGSTRGIYDLNGYLDEVKAWDRALSDAEISAIYGNENTGLQWDGSTRDCDNLSPVADWRMDEGWWTGAGAVKDSLNAAAGPHGTPFGGMQTNVNGKICSAGDFQQARGDGAGDYVVFPIPAVGLSKKRFSVSMWVNFNSFGDEMVLMHIVNSGTSSNRNFYLSTWQNLPDVSHNGLHFGTLNSDGSWGRGYASDTDVFTSTGQWYHVLAMVDAERGRLTAYVNGSLIADMSISPGLIPGTPTEIWIGGTPISGSRYFDGLIDEVLFFNGSLTAAQALSIYTSQLAKKNWDGTARTCPTYGIPTNFNCVESATAKTDAGATTGTLFTKLAGKGFTFDIVALKGTTTLVRQPLFATEADRPLKVELIDGSQGGTCASRSSILTLSAAFSFLRASAATEQGWKTFTVADGAIPSAYKNLRCRITDTTTTPGTPVYGCSSDNFAIRPAAVTLTTNATAPLSAPLNATTPVIKAGASFQLTATSATANYTDNVSLDTNKLSAQNPASSSYLAGGTVGPLTPTLFTVNSANANASYSEVGYLYLAAGALRDDSFTTVDQPNDCISDTTSLNYLSDVAIGGKYGCSVGNTSEITLGRFIPDHLTITQPVLNVRVASACSPASNFNYYDEDFSSDFTLTAQSVASTTTTNYTGLFARLNPQLWSAFGFVSSGVPLLNAQPVAALAAGSIAATGTFSPEPGKSSGVANVKQRHKLTVGVPPAEPATAVTLKALPVDADGVTLATGSAATLGSAAFRQGRARLKNALGAEILDLPVPFTIESWGGVASGWAVNTDDDCSSASVSLSDGKTLRGVASLLATQSCVVDGASCNSTRPGRTFSSTTAAGKFNLWLKAPGRGNSGYVTVNAAVPPYLEYDWKGAGKADPTARATFGVRKSSPVTFRREVFGR